VKTKKIGETFVSVCKEIGFDENQLSEEELEKMFRKATKMKKNWKSRGGSCPAREKFLKILTWQNLSKMLKPYGEWDFQTKQLANSLARSSFRFYWKKHLKKNGFEYIPLHQL